jgi:hypothetical protein
MATARKLRAAFNYNRTGWNIDRARRKGALMATRTYSSGNRQFVVTLVGTPAGSYSSWTVDSVTDAMTGDGVPVPGLQNVVASDEDTAFARACDRIESWSKLKP